MHIKFDLKGSTKGRKASKNELKKSHPTYKDLDLINKYSDNIFVDPDIRKVLLSTLEADCLVSTDLKNNKNCFKSFKVLYLYFFFRF